MPIFQKAFGCLKFPEVFNKYLLGVARFNTLEEPVALADLFMRFEVWPDGSADDLLSLEIQR